MADDVERIKVRLLKGSLAVARTASESGELEMYEAGDVFSLTAEQIKAQGPGWLKTEEMPEEAQPSKAETDRTKSVVKQLCKENTRKQLDTMARDYGIVPRHFSNKTKLATEIVNKRG